MNEKEELENVFNQIQQLGNTARRMLFALLGIRADDKQQKETEEESLEFGLYEAIREQFLALRGIKLKSYRSIAFRAQNRTALRDAIGWLGVSKLSRQDRDALFLLVAGAVVYELNFIPQDDLDYTIFLNRIPRCVERAYPGYRIVGLLTKIAHLRSQGQLVRNKMAAKE